MLGKYYEEHDGTRIECLGALPHYTKAEKNRFINDTIYEIETDGKKIKVAGIREPQRQNVPGRGRATLHESPQRSRQQRSGRIRGRHYKNTYGTYSHGSFLPKNPVITDMLLSLALKRKYGEDYILSELSTEAEDLARKQAIEYIDGSPTVHE